MDDQSLSLAFSMHNSPGVYAVLLGSGVSSTAGIPTGWGIVQDLCRKVAAASGDEPENDPSTWYQSRFDKEARYDELIESLAPTKHEQLDLLRGYFEPTQEDRERNRKTPTPAHKAIALLVQQGIVRLILTTNFDRLMEEALEQLSVPFQVAYTPEMVTALKPYAHASCTIVKLHGDYREASMRNVGGDLGRYEDAISEYLKRVFDDFGLIVAGWSGVWDPALRNAMLTSMSRRYSWYWLSREEQIPPEAKQIIEHKQAFVMVSPEGADSFFQHLQQQVHAINRLQLPHPKSSEVLVQISKDCLTRNRHIELYDLLIDEARRLKAIIDGAPIDARSGQEMGLFQGSLEKYMEYSKGLRGTLAQISFFGTVDHMDLMTRVVRLLSQNLRITGGTSSLLELRYFPSLLAVYAVGIGAVSNGRYQTLLRICQEPLETIHWSRDSHPYLSYVGPQPIFWSTNSISLLQSSSTSQRNLEFIRHAIRDDYKDILPLTQEFDRVYHRMEFVLGLIAVKTGAQRFTSESSIYAETVDVNQFLHEGKRAGDHWKLIEDLFDGDVSQFEECLEKYENQIVLLRRHLSQRGFPFDYNLKWTTIWRE